MSKDFSHYNYRRTKKGLFSVMENRPFLREYQLVFLHICISFCWLNGSPRMVRRCVNRINLERFTTGVDNIVPRTRRNENGASITYGALQFDAVSRRAHGDHSVSVFNSEKLVCVRMNFQSDISTYGNGHQCELQVTSGPQGYPVICVLHSSAGDIYNKWIRTIIFLRGWTTVVSVITVHTTTPFTDSICADIYLCAGAFRHISQTTTVKNYACPLRNRSYL